MSVLTERSPPLAYAIQLNDVGTFQRRNCHSQLKRSHCRYIYQVLTCQFAHTCLLFLLDEPRTFKRRNTDTQVIAFQLSLFLGISIYSPEVSSQCLTLLAFLSQILHNIHQIASSVNQDTEHFEQAFQKIKKQKLIILKEPS